MESRSVSDLWIYPIKSCRGISVQQFTLDDRGPELDRRWMLVDSDGQFITQREHPRMSLIDIALDDGDIVISAPGMSIHAFDPNAGTGSYKCVVWNSSVALQHVSDEIDQWFSDFLSLPCRLMRMPQSTRRIVNPLYSPIPRLVTLADGYPIMLIGAGSLDLLNEKLVARGQHEVPMTRFRPNVVITDTRPHEEDEWKSIRIGEMDFKIVKPCERCSITTVDLRTGILGKEPLRTLSEYRKVGSKVMFGQNVIHAAPGTLRVGDKVSLPGR